MSLGCDNQIRNHWPRLKHAFPDKSQHGRSVEQVLRVDVDVRNCEEKSHYLAVVPALFLCGGVFASTFKIYPLSRGVGKLKKMGVLDRY